MSALYDSWIGIGDTIYNRSQLPKRYAAYRDGVSYRGQCNPCDAVCGTRSNREAWVTPIYGNARGFGLMSGKFRNDYVNDHYAIGFGVDKVQGGLRLGVMGVGGWGKVRSESVLAKTQNETSWGEGGKTIGNEVAIIYK